MIQLFKKMKPFGEKFHLTLKSSLFITFFLLLTSMLSAQGIKTGVTFQWNDNQTAGNQPATIKSITVDGDIYDDFRLPSNYILTQLGPGGNDASNNIRKNSVELETTSASATWTASALTAFQDRDLTHYFEANGNGANICEVVDPDLSGTQIQTLIFTNTITSASSVLAVTERNANNCLYIKIYGIPSGGGPEQFLGATYVIQDGTRWGFGGTGSSGTSTSNLGTVNAIAAPSGTSDYWLADRVVENSANSLGIALFHLENIVPIGSNISKIEFIASTTDHGDGKVFVLNKNSDGDSTDNNDDLDDDNDGILDTDERTCSNTALVAANSVFNKNGVNNSNNLLDGINSNGAEFDAVNDELNIDLGEYIPSGTTLKFEIFASSTASKTITIEQTTWDSSVSTNTVTLTKTTTASENLNYILTEDTRFIKILMTADSGGILEIDYLEIQSYLKCIDLDTDGDLLPDHLDTDSDGDGCPDALEANGGLNPNQLDSNGAIIGTEDANGVPSLANGGQDDVSSTNSSIGSSYCDYDGDGVPESIDIDDDSDGILDIIESGGHDPDGDEDDDGIVNYLDNSDNGDGGPGGSTVYADSNGDGIPDVYDFDNDGVPNHLDIDSDNDGIPDNIEGQTTKGYLAPSGNDTDNDGLDDAYDETPNGNSDGTGSIGLTPTNTDSLDNPDYLDLDTDNDGINDIFENGDSDNVAFGTDVDNDGLDDAFDNVNDSGIIGATVNNGITTPDATNLGDADGDVNLSGGDVDYRDIPGVDSDGDTIADIDDLDDDNDGILDSEEHAACSLTESISYEFYNTVPSDDTVDNIKDLVAFEVGEIINFEVTELANSARGLPITNDENITEQYAIKYTAKINISTTGSYTFYTSSDDGSKLFINGAEIVNNDGLHGSQERSGLITLTAGLHEIIILFFEKTGGDSLMVSYQGPSIPKVEIPFSILSTKYCDTDGDGVPNYLDLDSDNDGIPDVIEADGTDLDKDGKADGSVGTTLTTNGVPSTAGVGGIGLTTTSTDTDGIPDYLDIDADNDGIPDNIEAQSSLGYVPPTGSDDNNDGIDNAYGTGITTPENTDGDTLADYLDADSDNDGTLDIAENGDPQNVLANADDDNDGLDNAFDDNDDSSINGSTVNDGLGADLKIIDLVTLENAYSDTDTDFNPGKGDLDYRDGPDNDNDGIIDSVDLDDDNDGILDIVESNGNNPDEDEDGDGIPNYRDTSDLTPGNGSTDTDYTDSNSDGIPDVYDNDGDGIPNHYDLDSDNDGITDAIEAGGTDANGDGIADGTIGNTPTTNGVPSSSGGGLGTGTTPTSTDGDTIPDYLDLDADNDGIPDNIEAQSTTGYTPPSVVFADTNNNGLDDVYENETTIGLTPQDTDSDGAPDYLDLNSDNDGAYDIVESGSGLPQTDGQVTTAVGSNGLVNTIDNGDDYTDVNGNFDDTQTDNFLDDDSDVNLSGGDVDYRDISGTDTDGDTITNVDDLDDDNDGILDTVENGIYFADGDEDGDGTPNYLDTTDNGDAGDSSTTNYVDNNSDGIPDVYDNDGDGIANHLDLDSDNDGIPDVIESGGTDANKDGRADGLVGLTPTTNGVPSSSGGGAGTGTTPTNTADGDSLPDYLDIDADNDGIPDNIEGQTSSGYIPPSGVGSGIEGITDVNKNGVDDAYENDAIIGLNPVNTDDTDTPDYIDTDADNDGILDIEENGDTDNVLAGTDTDNDGLDDNFDDNDDSTIQGSTVNDGLGIVANDGVGVGHKVTDAASLEVAFNDNDDDFPATGDLDYRDFPDVDNDGVADNIDLDDDNDGILDLAESNGNDPDGDADGDGIPNYKDTDDTTGGTSDGSTTDYEDLNTDGIPDVYDNDGDGIPNHLDLDSDNDGIPDVIESGGTDDNRDGLADDDDDNANNIGSNGIPTSAGTGITSPSNSDSADGDTLPDYLDIDSDNDGIPDNIEGQATSGYVAPSGVGSTMVDNNNNGLDDNYENDTLVGIAPEDTDNDTIPDYIDENSDNDGNLDIAENGDTDNVLSGGDLDGDGLYDIFDDYDDSSIQGATVNNGINPPNTSNLGDADGDLNTGGDVDYRDIPGDRDGDGVSDDVDLDDDNDGIIDVIENGNCSISDKEEILILYSQDFGTGTTRDEDLNVQNHLFDESDAIPDGSYAVVSSLNSGLAQYNRTDQNSDLDANIDQFSGPAGGSSNGRYLSINIGSGNADPQFYSQSLSNLIIGADYRYRLDLAGLCNSCADLPIFRLEVQNTSGTVLESISSAALNVQNNDIWKRVVLNFTATVTDVNIVIINEQGSGGAGNDVGVDNIVFGLLQCNPADNDFDNDGIINSLDLDSDNDGCPDALEGNGGFTFADLDSNNRIDNPVNANGIPINPGTIGGNTGQEDVSSVNASVQSVECDSCNINSSKFVDSDEDGVGDKCDLDDDNDGILDSVESGIYTPNGDEDGDGIPNYKDISDAGNNGDSSSTSYTDNNSDGIPDVYDTDGDGVPNHLDLDSDNDGIPDVIEAGGTDADRDGIADNVGTNTDGIPSTAGAGLTPTATADGDTLPDYLDIDADNDGIPDNIEGQPTVGYIAPTGTGSAMIDANNNGLDDNYETGGFVGLDPENTDGIDTPDYIDLDSDEDGIPDIQENGTRPDTLTSTVDSDGDGLYDIFEGADVNDGFDVNDEINIPNKDSLGDVDDDATTIGDVDYRDTGLNGVPMITQIYHLGTEKWIEITNIGTSTIPANVVKIQLYKDKTGDQTDVTPNATYTISSSIAAGQSVLFKHSANTTITNIVAASPTVTAIVVENDALTDIEGANDIITLSSTTDGTSWINRYDVISEFKNNTSYVRIDETLLPNTTYTESEWVVFVDDRETIGLDPYRLLGAGGAERHPHDPLISEIESSNTNANTLLGLHRIDITTTDGSGDWENGYPDRSRFVEIDDNYNHTSAKLSARKLRVNADKKLSVTDNLLVVTNNIFLNGDIRLVDSSPTTDAELRNSSAQLIQTHTDASLVTGTTGKLLVDQNSTVPSLYRYNYIGSPVKSSVDSATYTVADILKDGTAPANHGGTINTDIAKDINWVDGYDGNFTNSPTAPISLANYWIYTYASNGGTRSFWTQKFSYGAIPNADGFIFKGPGRAQNYTYLGTPKDGNITTFVGKNESYLIANPYASAISVKEFIEDNINSISGTLYFWEHAGEETVNEGSAGHNFAGYIGGYATVNLIGGVSARGAATGSVDINLEAEAANDADENIATSEQILDNSVNINVVRLETVGSLLKFESIPSGVDNLRIRYKSTIDKKIIIKVEGEFVKSYNFTLPQTSGNFSVLEIARCVEAYDDISIISDDTNLVYIDYLNLYDLDGQIACAPSLGGEDIEYTEPKKYIAIGQGFFVDGDDTNGGVIEFNNSQREYKTEGTESVFLKSSSKKSVANSISNIPVIKLGMNFNGSNENEKYHRQIAVGFSPYTSFDYDNGYDSELYDIGSTDFYFKFPSDQRKFVISGVQEISSDLQVPLEITMGYSGNVTIKVDEMKNVTDNVYITDKLTNKSYDIIKGSAILTLNEGTYTDRFVLAFSSSTALSIDDTVDESAFTNLYVDNKNHQLMISKNLEIEISKVELYDILGKKVGLWNIEEQKSTYQLKIKEQLPTGVYIVKMNTSKGETNKKIIIE